MRTLILVASLTSLLNTSAFADGRKPELKEMKSAVGTDDNVKVEAHLYAGDVNPSSVVQIICTVQNERPDPILVADLNTQTDYDPDSRTITVTLGSEIPINNSVSKLVRVDPGQTREFKKGARMNVFPATQSRMMPVPMFVRLKVNFLGAIQPFLSLLTGKADMQAAARQIFPAWIEHNEAIETNTIPIRWGRASDSMAKSGAYAASAPSPSF